jgi:Fe-S-cluster containining protein
LPQIIRNRLQLRLCWHYLSGNIPHKSCPRGSIALELRLSLLICSMYNLPQPQLLSYIADPAIDTSISIGYCLILGSHGLLCAFNPRRIKDVCRAYAFYIPVGFILTCPSQRRCVMASGIQHSGLTLLDLLVLLPLFFRLMLARASLCLPPTVPELPARILGRKSVPPVVHIKPNMLHLSQHPATPISSVCPSLLGCNAPSCRCSARGTVAHTIYFGSVLLATYHLHHHLDLSAHCLVTH